MGNRVQSKRQGDINGQRWKSAAKQRRPSISQPIEYRVISLTRNTFALVDIQDFDLSEDNWSYSGGYAINKSNTKGARRMHRVILERMLCRPLHDGEIVDHINGNRSDNRRHNLRLSTQAHNHFNMKIRSDNKSGYKGVWYDKNLGKFTAYIRRDGKRKHIGVYVTAVDAAKAYNHQALIEFGEFAKINPIPNEAS